MPHEAILYRKTAENRCECFLCAHRCRIAPGRRGVCRVRENRDGTLYSLVFGMLISANLDPIEKKPLYHFMPGTRSLSIATVGCNFRCDFCQNWQISQADTARIPGEFTPPEKVVELAERQRAPSISYTYTEPTIYFEYAMDCARLAQARGIRNVFVTNGYQTPETIDAMAGVIDAANVDLKAYSDAFYRERCGGHLEPVKEAIRLMHQAGIFIEVTTLLIPGYNDAPEELKALTAFLAGISPDMPWHVSRYHPDHQFDRAPATPAERILEAVEIGRAAGLRYVYAGNMPAGKYEHTWCPSCNHLLIERAGFRAEILGLDKTRCRRCGAEIALRL